MQQSEHRRRAVLIDVVVGDGLDAVAGLPGQCDSVSGLSGFGDPSSTTFAKPAIACSATNLTTEPHPAVTMLELGRVAEVLVDRRRLTLGGC